MARGRDGAGVIARVPPSGPSSPAPCPVRRAAGPSRRDVGAAGQRRTAQAQRARRWRLPRLRRGARDVGAGAYAFPRVHAIRSRSVPADLRGTWAARASRDGRRAGLFRAAARVARANSADTAPTGHARCSCTGRSSRAPTTGSSFASMSRRTRERSRSTFRALHDPSWWDGGPTNVRAVVVAERPRTKPTCASDVPVQARGVRARHAVLRDPRQSRSPARCSTRSPRRSTSRASLPPARLPDPLGGPAVRPLGGHERRRWSSRPRPAAAR